MGLVFMETLGYTEVLHLAAGSGNLTLTKALIFLGADVDTRKRYKSFATPLHSAVANGQLPTVKFLLEEGADPNAKDLSSRTPLMFAAQDGKMGAAELLLERGADPNVGGRMGYTPLYLALQYGHYDLADTLVDRGALIDFHCLNLVLGQGTAIRLEFLHRHGVDLAEMAPTSTTLLWKAVAAKDEYLLYNILPFAKAQFTERYGNDVNTDPTLPDDRAIAVNLLSEGFEKEIKSALNEDSPFYLGYLVLHGTRVYHNPENDPLWTEELSDLLDSTPITDAIPVGTIPSGGVMHRAVLREDPRLVRRLLEAGFPSDAKDLAGRPPLEWAVILNLKEIRELLENTGN